MKTSIHVFWILASFFWFATILYTIWSLLDPFHGYVEWVGTLAMALCGVLFALVAYYLGNTYRSQGGELPEDIATSDIDDGDPEMGFYSPWSWWPVMVGLGIGLVFLGLAVGFWIAYIGAALAFMSVVGWVFEYYRGYFGR